jgi:hypothetical protein
MGGKCNQRDVKDRFRVTPVVHYAGMLHVRWIQAAERHTPMGMGCRRRTPGAELVLGGLQFAWGQVSNHQACRKLFNDNYNYPLMTTRNTH